MEFTFETELHYLVHEADGDKVAHCLDLDLVGVGQTNDEAIDALNSAVVGMILFVLKTESFSALPAKAPKEYWEMFEVASQAGITKSTLEIPEGKSMTVNECHYRYCVAVAA
jgi:hypothetical protein